MASSLKRIDSGWLARSVQEAACLDQTKRNWAIQVTNNWVSSGSSKQTAQVGAQAKRAGA